MQPDVAREATSTRAVVRLSSPTCPWFGTHGNENCPFEAARGAGPGGTRRRAVRRRSGAPPRVTSSGLKPPRTGPAASRYAPSSGVEGGRRAPQQSAPKPRTARLGKRGAGPLALAGGLGRSPKLMKRSPLALAGGFGAQPRGSVDACPLPPHRLQYSPARAVCGIRARGSGPVRRAWRGLSPAGSPTSLRPLMLGRGQAVRRGTLDPVFEGSNPSAPASAPYVAKE